MYEICVEHLNRDEPVPESSWYVRQENEELSKLNADLLTQETLSKNWEKRGIFVALPATKLAAHAEQVVLRFKDAKLKKRLQDIREALKNHELPEKEREPLMEEFIKLNAIKQKVSKRLNRVV